MAKENKEKGVLGSIFLTYFVLILHALLIIFLGVAVVFFRGVVEYMHWILLGGFALIGASCYFFYRRMKKSNRHLRDVMNDPAFRGRSLEISFLGGLASVRVGQPGGQSREIDVIDSRPIPQLESPETSRVRQLESLARLLENGLLTEEEYRRLKSEVMEEGGSGGVRDIDSGL